MLYPNVDPQNGAPQPQPAVGVPRSYEVRTSVSEQRQQVGSYVLEPVNKGWPNSTPFRRLTRDA
jgi:hypothetical protein